MRFILEFEEDDYNKEMVQINWFEYLKKEFAASDLTLKSFKVE